MQIIDLNQNNNDMVESCVSALSAAITKFGGTAGAIVACERMYQATFRSPPYPKSDCAEACDTSTLKIDLAVTLYTAQTGSNKPGLPDDNCSEHDMDNYYYSLEAFEGGAEDWFDAQYPSFEITKDTLLVSFFNYKGEHEGEGLYCLYKNLPVFTSKQDSFCSANAH
jgi:hypothetical protein